MITFVYGAPGSGKTHYIFERLKENSKKSFMIVPEQETVIVERKALETLPMSSQLEFEALNFTRLCNRVFRELGGLSYNYITPSVKKLFMWRTLRELAPLLSEYRDVTSDISLTETMQKSAEELTMCSVSPTMLENAAKKLPDGPLRSKLTDIALINSAYHGLINESFDDRSEDMAKLCELLAKNNFFEGAQVFIDSFTSFTSPEYKIIEHIFRQADNVTVALSCESPNCNLICCESVCDTAKRLLELAASTKQKTEKIYLTGNFRANNSELASLVTDFWAPGKAADAEKTVKESDRGNVKLLRCRDPYEEADAAVTLVKSEIMKGLHYREIAIIARNASDYSGIVDAALENAGIPYFMSEKTDVSASPAMAFLLSALRIICFSYKSEDVIALLKTGLCELSIRDIDMFEAYVYTWSISGKRFLDEKWEMNPDGYTSRVSARGEEILGAANRVREKLTYYFVPFSEEFRVSKSTKEMCVAVYGLISSMGIPDKLRELAAKALESGQKRRASDTLSVLNAIYDILNDLAIAFADEKLTEEEFYRAFRMCASEASVGSIPTGYDEVTVGSAAMLRADNIRCAIILGLNEGIFPASVKDNGIFTDADRHSLEKLGINLSSDSVKRSAEELLYARRAMSVPSDRLYLLYASASSSSSPQRPSIIINRISSYLGYLDKDHDFKSNSADAVYTVSGAREILPRIKGTPLEKAIRAELSEYPGQKLSPSVKLESFSIPSELAASHFTSEMHLSQSSIDSFVECSLGYYCNYVLRLRGEEKAELDRRIAGSFIHRVLEKYLREHVSENEFDTEDPEKIVDEVITSVIAEICTESQRSSNRLSHLFIRLRRLSLLMIRSLTEEFASARFTPEFYELRIGKCGIPPLEFRLNDGSSVTLNGIVDRVDVAKEDGDVYIRIVDYKTGSKKFSVNDLKDGLNLQLLIYLFTLCRKESSLADTLGAEKILPAGANYLSSSISSISYSDIPSEDTVLGDALSRLNRSGFSVDDEKVKNAYGESKNKSISVMSLSELEELRTLLEDTVVRIADEMRSGNIDAKPRIDGSSPCNYCKMASVCRKAQKTSW